MATHRHICYNLQVVKNALAEDKHESLFLVVDGRPATKQEILDEVIEAMGNGYEVLPPCDNVDSKGHCAGHEVQAKKRGYYVSVPDEPGVSIAVVFTSSREAKRIGFNYLNREYGVDFLDVRVKWKQDANVDDIPVGIIEDYLIGLKCGIYGFIFGKCEKCNEETYVAFEEGAVICGGCCVDAGLGVA